MTKTQMGIIYRFVHRANTCIQCRDNHILCPSIGSYWIWTVVPCECYRFKGVSVRVLEKRWSGRVTLDMQDPNRRIKRRGKLYFSSTKALKTSRMGKKKMALDRIETHGINKVLDFEDKEDNATLSTVGESEDRTTSRGRGSQSQGTSKNAQMQSNPTSNPASNPASEDQSAEEAEETSLMQTEGRF